MHFQITWFLRSTGFFSSNGVSISSAVCAGLSSVSNRQTHTETTLRHDVCSNSPHSTLHMRWKPNNFIDRSRLRSVEAIGYYGLGLFETGRINYKKSRCRWRNRIVARKRVLISQFAQMADSFTVWPNHILAFSILLLNRCLWVAVINYIYASP